MGRIIEGQVVAGTGFDSQGERLTREELEMLFRLWDEEVPSGVNHDLAQTPVCRTFNQRLDLQPNGEWALKVDVEVFDEEAFSKFGGFSIAFSRRRTRIGPDPAAVEVSANPRHFDIEHLVRALAAINSRTGTVDLVERVEKASLLETAVISIAVFVGLQTFSGFFNAAGAALFELLRKQRRKDEPTAPVSIQFHLHPSADRRVPVIILVVDPDCTLEDVRAVDGPRLLELVAGHFDRALVQRVTARVLSGGVVRVERIVGRDGRVIYNTDA